MPQPHTQIISRRNSLRTKLIVVALSSLLLVGVAIIWQIHQKPPTLLPKSIVAQLQGFKVYFYTGKVPASYDIDQTRVTYSQGALFVPLVKGADTITLSEQAMPSGLSRKTLQQNGEVIDRTAGESTINSVEGRLVGTFISDDSKTLVLITTDDDSDTSKSTLKLLLRGLQPIE